MERAEFLPVTWPAREAAAAEGSLDASAPLPADGGYIPVNQTCQGYAWLSFNACPFD